jgi:hypothetical protein
MQLRDEHETTKELNEGIEMKTVERAPTLRAFRRVGDFDFEVQVAALLLCRRRRVPLRLAVKRVLAFLGAEMKFPSAIF